MNNSKLTFQMNDDLIEQYAKTSKDYNPIHLNKDAALAVKLPNKVAHGMLTIALATKLITPFLQGGWFVYSHKTKLLLPVFVDDTILITLKCLDYTNQIEVHKLTCLNAAGHAVFSSKLKLKKLPLP